MNKRIENHFKGGVIKQPEDKRDFIFKATIPQENLPKYFINSHIREIENQLQTGSCVANCTCSGLEMMYTKSELDLSRMFVYYNAREPYEYLKEQDIGAYVRDGFKSISKRGVCSEKEWPFVVVNVNEKPSETSYELAKENLVLKYERLEDVNAIKSAVVQHQAVVFGIPLKSDFFDIQGPMDTHNYQAKGYDVGGHAMSIVGYDDDLDGFIIENSWGKFWGDRGLALIKYSIFLTYYFDVWTASELDFERNLEPEVKPEVKPEAEKDDLTKIVGVGKAYQSKLNNDGFFTYKQVANMTEEEIQIMEVKYSFNGDFKESVAHAKELS